MKRRSGLRLAAAVGLVLGLSLPDTVHGAPITTSATGLGAADIQAQVDAFRAASAIRTTATRLARSAVVTRSTGTAAERRRRRWARPRSPCSRTRADPR